MTNREIAAALEEIADLLEFQGANPFRVRAYRNGSRKVKDSPASLASVVEESGAAALTEIDGVGKDLAEKIAELATTGALAMLDEFREQVEPGVLKLMRVPGLGPKKAAVLHKELGVATLDQLKAACQAEQVRGLKGFGKKTEETILAGVELAERAGGRTKWADADAVVERLLAHMDGLDAVKRREPAGSYRRGKETVGDLDLLVDVGAEMDADAVAAVMDRFGEFEGVAEVIARGDTKMSVRLDSDLQIDLRCVPSESFGAALQYFTGSKEHNVEVRGLAKALGLKVNEWGVFKTDGDERIAGDSEEEVYAALGLPVFPPELRENRQEFAAAEADGIPKLIELTDLRGDLHMHTSATDGSATLREMVAAARARGLEYIAITDHSKRVTMAHGLDAERLRAQWAEIDVVNAELADEGAEFRVLKGIECDILESGPMDLEDDVLAEADWVIASLHYGQNQPRAKIMERLLGAVAHPSVSIVAHPTGRLIGKRAPYDLAVDELIAAAAEHGKLLELNANPMRLDLDDVHCAAAKAAGVKIVISSDAHSTDGLGVLRYGVLQARRAGLEPFDVLNTRRGIDWLIEWKSLGLSPTISSAWRDMSRAAKLNHVMRKHRDAARTGNARVEKLGRRWVGSFFGSLVEKRLVEDTTKWKDVWIDGVSRVSVTYGDNEQCVAEGFAVVVRGQDQWRLAPIYGRFEMGASTLKSYRVELAMQPSEFDSDAGWSIPYTQDASRDAALAKALANRESWPTVFTGT